MVHGGCLSIGCFAMTNAVVDEMWRLVTAALDKGQPRVRRAGLSVPHDGGQSRGAGADRWGGFWADLKKGYDLFERTHVPPVVSVCDGRYVVADGSAATGAKPRRGSAARPSVRPGPLMTRRGPELRAS